ncbi:MAG TPA: DegT/DnrJ/EryC1/StrS family aminotransferase, partial [Treponemataceae bacterium]|nr:DegT/DnrJ/EryC1/StrS family aminotransferase [Treponemataceae bacterium]
HEAAYGMSRDAAFQKLKDHGINARRYFYPLISDFPIYSGLPSASSAAMPVAARAAAEVICIPIYPNLAEEDIARVVGALRP